MGLSRQALSRLVGISWKNVFRNRRRTLLTVTVLIMGSTGLILIGGFFDNILEGLRENIIHGQTGHIQVSARDYALKGVTAPLEYLMGDTKRLQSRVESLNHVSFTIPRLTLSGMANSDKTSVAVLLIGTDPELERRMGSVKKGNSKVPSMNIVEGKDLSADDPYGATLGRGLLSELGLKIGDSVTVVTTREAGAIDSASYVVRGTFETIMKEADDHAMRVNLPTVQKLAGVEDRIQTLLVVLDDTAATDTVKPALDRLIRDEHLGLETRTWIDIEPSYWQSRAMLDKIYSVIQLIVAMVFFLSVSNTINMSILERIREFGTMMAIGNSRLTVFSMIALEALFTGLLGGALGVLVGAVIAKIISVSGIEMPPPPQGSEPYLAIISLSAPLLIRTFLISTVSTLISGTFPALRAVRLRIVEALGYV